MPQTFAFLAVTKTEPTSNLHQDLARPVHFLRSHGSNLVSLSILTSCDPMFPTYLVCQAIPLCFMHPAGPSELITFCVHGTFPVPR